MTATGKLAMRCDATASGRDRGPSSLLRGALHFVRNLRPRPERWGLRAAHLRDPDGNLLEIQTY
ncbi:hypothetical protein [Streptomyces sp. NPDC001948]